MLNTGGVVDGVDAASSHALLAGLWLVPSCGGMAKTVGCFQRALDANVVSFTKGDELDREGSAVAGAVHVRAGSDFWGRRYTWAPKERRVAADALAGQADFISCHAVYAYHLQWTKHWVRARNLPYWAVPHGSLDPYVFSYRGLQKRIFLALVAKSFFRDASHVIYSTRREMEKASPVHSGDNGRVVRWPVDMVEIHNRGSLRRLARQRLGIASDAKVLLFLGRLHPMKRPLETIAAAAGANRPDLHLVLAGPEHGISRADCEAAARKHGLKNIHVMGGVWGKEKEALYGAVDGFISLSHRENFGHSAAEAMSAELPVILSPGNDLCGEFGGLECGWMLADDRVETAVNAVREFGTASAERRAAMGAAGRRWVAGELSFDRFSTRLHGLMAEAITAKRGRPA